VTLSAAAATLTVDYATAGGTGHGRQRLYIRIGTLTFAAGETSKTISVPVIGDTMYETDESFSVTLENSSGPLIADSVGIGTIMDDDAQRLPAQHSTAVMAN
jgi:hypothetical protein